MSAAEMLAEAPRADPSLRGKLRRKQALLCERRPLATDPTAPMVSFSFDDAPASAFRTGAAVLEDAGVFGTYYVCGALMGQDGPMGRYGDADAVAEAAQAGHEIGCHTLNHLDCGPAEARAMAREVEANRWTLAGVAVSQVTTFAYPFGDVSPAAKATLGPRFDLLRAIHPGLMRRGADLNQAPAVGIEGEEGEARAAAWIDRAARSNGWLILYTHDVRETPSPWGCTPGALERLVARATGAGCEILPVADALARIRR